MRSARVFFVSMLVFGLSATAEESNRAMPADAPIFVHLDTVGKNVELVRLLGTSVSTARTTSGQTAVISTIHVERMCHAPCNRLVPGGMNNQYFVVGKGMPASDVFDFGAHDQAVKVTVEPGSNLKRTGGWLLGAAAITGVVGGGSLLAVGALTGAAENSGSAHPAAPDRTSTSVTGGFTTLGVVGLAAGAALLVPAIWMGVTSGTKTATEPAPNLAPQMEQAPRPTTGFEVRYGAPGLAEVEG